MRKMETMDFIYSYLSKKNRLIHPLSIEDLNSDVERVNELIDVFADELISHGFREENWEPNVLGCQLEEVIDFLLDIRDRANGGQSVVSDGSLIDSHD